MGMFDTVHLICPHCEEKTSFQSKAGPCELKNYDERRVPFSILASIDKEVIVCDKCGEKIKLSSGWIPIYGALGTYPV